MLEHVKEINYIMQVMLPSCCILEMLSGSLFGVTKKQRGEKPNQE